MKRHIGTSPDRRVGIYFNFVLWYAAIWFWVVQIELYIPVRYWELRKSKGYLSLGPLVINWGG